MTRTSHVYLHIASIGVREACVAVRAAFRPVLKAMYARGEVLGYRLFLLDDREAAEGEILHHMFDYDAAIQGRFPFVYASLTPLDNDDSNESSIPPHSHSGVLPRPAEPGSSTRSPRGTISSDFGNAGHDVRAGASGR